MRFSTELKSSTFVISCWSYSASWAAHALSRIQTIWAGCFSMAQPPKASFSLYLLSCMAVLLQTRGGDGAGLKWWQSEEVRLNRLGQIRHCPSCQMRSLPLSTSLLIDYCLSCDGPHSPPNLSGVVMLQLSLCFSFCSPPGLQQSSPACASKTVF